MTSRVFHSIPSSHWGKRKALIQVTELGPGQDHSVPKLVLGTFPSPLNAPPPVPSQDPRTQPQGLHSVGCSFFTSPSASEPPCPASRSPALSPLAAPLSHILLTLSSPPRCPFPLRSQAQRSPVKRPEPLQRLPDLQGGGHSSSSCVLTPFTPFACLGPNFAAFGSFLYG